MLVRHPNRCASTAEGQDKKAEDIAVVAPKLPKVKAAPKKSKQGQLSFEDGKWEHVGAAEKGTCHLDFECTEDGEYLLRLQPELLGAGQYSLTLERTPTYSAFPVQGKDSRAIWSVFGDDRDGGKRRHEGIDIFAERGTPVVAPVSGVVSSIRNGGLGGKSVWMRDHTRGHSLYFAHLDSQAVNSGKSVKTGDTLGFVGNTGNARNTKPHLHFGIYVRFQGAIDPYPFVDNQLREAPVINGFPTERYQVVNGAKANFRQGPAMDFKVISSLDEGDLVWVKGQTNEWVQVETPDLRSGFIHSSLLTLPSPNVESGKERWAFWDPFVHPADSFQLREGRLAVLGSFKGYRWARDEEGHSFWISSN